MSEMKKHFELVREAFGPNIYNDFMIKHGRDYPKGPNTFAGPRGEQHGCFMNATHLAISDHSLTYCEGKIAIHGVPLDHAWCIDADGVVVDPTVTDVGQVYGYFGVPLSTEYVLKASKFNRIYGCLDFFYARHTAPKLYELGLEAGQQWLLDQPAVKRTRKRRAA